MKARAQTPLAAAGSDALLDHLLDLTLDVALLARRLDRGDVGSRRDDHAAQLVLHDELGALQKSRVSSIRRPTGDSSQEGQRTHLVALGVRLVREGERVALDEVRRLVGVEVDGEDCEAKCCSGGASGEARGRDERTELVEVPFLDRLGRTELLLVKKCERAVSYARATGVEEARADAQGSRAACRPRPTPRA